MKLLRLGAPGRESPACLDAQGRARDLTAWARELNGDALGPEHLRQLGQLDLESLPRADPDARVGPCVAGTGKLVGIGLNYRDHAAETGQPLPEEPILFLKATSAICGPHDALQIPPGSTHTDWEVELGVVIGTAGRGIPETEALAHVAGYCVVNDVSERDWQMHGAGQWTRGKSWDSFAPLGPWLVTADEIPDPQRLRLWLEVDGRRMQDGTSADMIVGVAGLVAHVSRFMRLEPGDVISTGTPAGVALGRPDAPYLKPGQTVRAGIEGLGEQRMRCVPG